MFASNEEGTICVSWLRPISIIWGPAERRPRDLVDTGPLGQIVVSAGRDRSRGPSCAPVTSGLWLRAERRYPEVAAHLQACGPCAEDLEGLLAAIRTDLTEQ